VALLAEGSGLLTSMTSNLRLRTAPAAGMQSCEGTAQDPPHLRTGATSGMTYGINRILLKRSASFFI